MIAECRDAKTLIGLLLLRDRLRLNDRRCTGQAPRRGRRRIAAHMAIADARRHALRQPFEHLLLDFLAYLEFERGLSRNTLEAYRSDLLQYGEWLRRTGHDPLDRRPRRAERVRRRDRRRARRTGRRPRPRRSSARSPACARSTATCAARPSSPTDPTAHLRAPKQGRKLPQVLSRDEVAELLRQPRGTEPAALRDRALLETMYACGLRASEAIDLEVGDLDLEAGILRARGKGSKERLVPVGSAASRALGAYLQRGRAAAGRRALGGAAVRQPARRRPHAPGALQDRPAPRRDRRPGVEDEPAHAAPHVRDAPAGRRLRPALAAGDARPRRHRHDAALHAPLGRAAQGRLLRRPPRARVA